MNEPPCIDSKSDGLTLTSEIVRVAEFHRAIGARVGDKPGLLLGDAAAAGTIAAELRKVETHCREIASGNDEFLLRLAMAIEELAEWAEAHAAGDLIDAVDAWGDRLYVLLGDAVAAGLPGAAIFEEVHRSNMTKAHVPADPNGKAIKSVPFNSPQLHKLIFRS